MPPMSWRHHALIQVLLSRGPLNEDEFLSIFSQVTGKNSGSQQPLFNEFLRKINAELSYVQFELRACRNQYDGDVYYGVVNNVSDDQSKLGTKYTVPQIAFYRGIVEAIIQDAEASGLVSSTTALNVRLETQVQGTSGSESQADQGQATIPPAFKNFSMSQKEKTIELLIKDRWLCSMTDGKIGIGVRSFLDLRSWFRTNDVSACEVCNEAAVKAELCQNEACNVRLHRYCLKKKFAQKRVERVCPGCGTSWPGSTVETEAVLDEDDPDVPPVKQELPETSTIMRERSKQGSDNHGKPLLRKRQRPSEEAKPSSSAIGPSVTSAAVTKRLTRRSARLNVD